MTKSITYKLTGNSIVCQNPKATRVDSIISVNGKSTQLTVLEGMLSILIESVGIAPKDAIEQTLQQGINKMAKVNKRLGEIVKDQRPSFEFLISRLESYGAVFIIDWDDNESVQQIIDLYADKMIIPVFKSQNAVVRTMRKVRSLCVARDDVAKFIDSCGCCENVQKLVDFLKVTVMGFNTTGTLQYYGVMNGISSSQIARILLLLYLDGHITFADANDGGENHEARK